MIVPIEEVDPEESVWLATSIPESIAQHKKARHGAAYGTIAALSAAALGAAYCYSKKRSGVEKDDYVRAPLLWSNQLFDEESIKVFRIMRLNYSKFEI